MSLPETSLPEPNQNSRIYPKPKIHTSQLIATANQKITLEVTVLKVTRHLLCYSFAFLFNFELELPSCAVV